MLPDACQQNTRSKQYDQSVTTCQHCHGLIGQQIYRTPSRTCGQVSWRPSLVPATPRCPPRRKRVAGRELAGDKPRLSASLEAPPWERLARTRQAEGQEGREAGRSGCRTSEMLEGGRQGCRRAGRQGGEAGERSGRMERTRAGRQEGMQECRNVGRQKRRKARQARRQECSKAGKKEDKDDSEADRKQGRSAGKSERQEGR